MRGNLKVLGIESTAHTFSASVVTERDGVLTNTKDVYMPPEGSGIHPAEAADHHLAVAVRVVHEALERKGERGSDIGERGRDRLRDGARARPVPQGRGGDREDARALDG